MSRISSEIADQDLPEYWAGFIARINRTTEWDLNQRNPASVDQLILRINPPKDGKPESHEKIKKVWRTTLVCVDKLGVFVQRFGQFAVQGASIVFGPSQQCFNAISFVITAAQKYKEVFSNITTLMERISVFLENLGVFMDDTNAEVKLDKRLRKTVYRVLEHFVTILSTTHKLTTDGNWKARAKLAVKNFALGEDEGIKGSLETLETLVSDFTNTSITVIVKDLGDAAKNIRGVEKKVDILDEKADRLVDSAEKQTSMLGQLVVAADNKTAREQETKDLEIIRTAFGLDPLDESKKSWDRQMELWDDHVPGTGQWLLDRPSFSKWSDPRATSVAFYTLKGPPGFGKSYLTSIVIQALRDKHRDDPRVFIAYYYLQTPGDRTSPVIKALKTIILQFANARRSEYAKLAAKVCDGRADFSNAGELWRRLITETTKNLEGTLFVVLDGLNELEAGKEKPLLEMINQVEMDQRSDVDSRFKIRVFLSGTHNIIDSLKVSSDIVLPEVNLEGPSQTEQSLNETDVQLYIEDQLNKMDRFDQSETGLKERIKIELSRGVRGDYSQVRLLLHDISSSQYTSQIEDVLKRASESRADLIASKIGMLNNTLDKKEIRDINELLSWISASFEYFDSKQLEAILSLKGDPPRSLEKQIRERYNILFELDDDLQVTMRNGIVDYLNQTNNTTSNGDSQAERRSADTIQELEVALVRKILQTHFRNVFGDEQVYAKFAFDEFFEKKLGDQAVRVQLNESESHTRVAQGCFAAMCDKYNDPRTEPLLDYAYKWFVEHLGEVKLDQTDAATKQDIGRKLVRLLREPALIESWWTEDRMYLKQWFVYSSGEGYCRTLLQVIHAFLKDPVVLQGMSDMPNERQWITNVTSGEEPSFELYASTAKIMARRWFEAEDEDTWQDAFSWLSGYVLVSRGELPDEDDPVSADQINEVHIWTKNELANEDRSDEWNERLAATFFLCKCWENAVEHYREAIERKPSDWRLRMNLAKSLGNTVEYDEAVRTLEDLIQRHTELLNSDEEYTEMYWTDMLLSLGNWNIERKDFGAAERAYLEILDHSFQQHNFEKTDMDAAVGMLSALNNQERHTDAISLLIKLSTYSDPDGISWLALLFQENCEDDMFHTHLTTAAKRSQILRTVAEQYEHAIEVTRAQGTQPQLLGEKLWRLLSLQHFLAALLWTLGSEEDQDAALDLWQQIVGRELNTDSENAFDERWRQFAAAQRLAPALLAKAKATGLHKGLNTGAATYLERIEWLIDLDLASVRPVSDPRILLARSYHLAGEKVRARSVLSEYLRTAMQEQTEENSSAGLDGSFYRIAVALQALDDDENAIAAWCQHVPFNIAKDIEGDGDTSESLPGCNGTSVAVVTDQYQGEDARLEALQGAERDEGANDIPPQHVNGVQVTDEDASSQGSETDSEEPELKGPLTNLCDGNCETNWTYADDMYVCKDCLDVQFDHACYLKLKAGELDVAICGRDHDHLHVPPFDVAAWKKIPNNSVIIGGKLMSRQAWIDGIAKDWGVDAESIEKKRSLGNAAQKIQRIWKVYKAVQKG